MENDSTWEKCRGNASTHLSVAVRRLSGLTMEVI
jgi:hypothetical protein